MLFGKEIVNIVIRVLKYLFPLIKLLNGVLRFMIMLKVWNHTVVQRLVFIFILILI